MRSTSTAGGYTVGDGQILGNTARITKMHILVACSECHRRYDATGRRMGRRFRCRCGVVVTVQPPAVTTPRLSAAPSAGLPERRRAPTAGIAVPISRSTTATWIQYTPSCLARVSSRAGFCHHCGQRGSPPKPSPKIRPRWRVPCVASRNTCTRGNLVGLEALECGDCVGLWLATAAFEQLTEQAADAAWEQVRLLSRKPVRAVQ